MYNIDDLNEEATYLVCDDIPFEKFPAFKAIIGAQESFVLTDRYRQKKTIEKWSLPCIICLNPDMDYESKMDTSLLEWFKCNRVKVNIHSNLF